MRRRCWRPCASCLAFRNVPDSVRRSRVTNKEERISVAVYMRVSSDDQRDRETIKTQREAIERFLAANPQYHVYRYYADDGISGTVPMALRPAGGQMVADAKAGK